MPSIFGISDVQLRTIPTDSTIGGVLQQFGNDIQEALKNNLDKYKHNDASVLRPSIIFKTKFLGQAWAFKLSHEDYGTYLDEGVTGVGNEGLEDNPNAKTYVPHITDGTHRFSFNAKPSVSHFLQWSNNKGFSPFAVRESVWRKGIKATHWYAEIVTEQRIDKLVVELNKAGAREIALSIADGLKGKTK